MAADNIAVPSWTDFVERDLREAILQLDDGTPQIIDNTLLDAETAPAVLDARVKRSGRVRKSRAKQGGAAGVRKFANAWLVFVDLKKDELRSKTGGGSTAMTTIMTTLAAEWRQMSTSEKAPYQKEFENRKRLYELENPGFTTSKTQVKSTKPRLRLAPMGLGPSRYEVTRIEHLPHCPIAVKGRITDEMHQNPFTVPSVESAAPKKEAKKHDLKYPHNGTSAENKASSAMAEAAFDCIACPKTYAYCGYCRSIGYTGQRIMHFESTCRTKVRNGRASRAGIEQSSSHSRPPLASMHPPMQSISKPIVPLKAVQAVDEALSKTDLEATFWGKHPAENEAPPVEASWSAEDMPDLAAIDALLVASGLRPASTM